jgi:ankyrin repeat protein
MAGLRTGKVEFVKALLAHGANPNARVKSTPTRVGVRRSPLAELVGATPFLLAATAGDASVMRVLAEAGADVRLGTTANATPLMAAAGLGRTPGEHTVKERSALQAAKLVLEMGTDVNAADDSGITALHYAAFSRLDSVTFTIERSSTGDLLRKLGARTIAPAYERSRPKDWPDHCYENTCKPAEAAPR